ncbi:MAG: sugar ABC transporter permease YjfF [Azospirillaceae bacterium]|nr:sugar ABC transporter permease YjfF [Azospirillaceae bacterium]
MNQRFLPLIATIIVFVVGYLFCALQFNHFATLRVVMNLLTDNAFIGIIAVGMTFVILSGGIDLSVGSIIAFTTVVLAVLIGSWHVNPWVAFAMVLVLGGAFGAGMGAIIHFFQLPPFIVTLSGMFLVRGLAFVISTESIPINHPLFAQLNDIVVVVPGGSHLTLIAMVMLVVLGIGTVLAHLTRFGTNVFALGGNRVSAQLMGVPIARTTISIYALSSLLAALSGIVFSLYTAAGYALAGTGVELDTIAAVVIGGTLLSGGAGHMLGSFLGVMIEGLIQTYISFDGTLSSWWTKIAIGVLLFMFIGLQRLLTVVWAAKASAPSRPASGKAAPADAAGPRPQRA